jgi:hypothetical protein
MLHYEFKTLTTGFKVLPFVQLHPAFYQLNRRNYSSVDQTCKSPIFNPIPKAELLFVGDLFVELVASKNYCIYHRYCDQRIVNPIKKRKKIPLPNHPFEVLAHL